MPNLRLITIKAEDSVTIMTKFTHELNPLINTANVVITSNTLGVQDPSVLKLEFNVNVLIITTQPLTPLAAYTITFQSTDSVIFNSINAQATLFEDGTTNAPLIIGPEDPDDPVRRFLTDFLKYNVYNLDSGTLVRDIINSQSSVLARALHDVGQAKNDNYLQTIISDEHHTRGAGPYDRMREEGAFEVMRVGRQPGATTTSGTISFDLFPAGPITLQSVTVSSESLVAGVGDSTFDSLVLTVANAFVTKLNSVIITYADSSTASYDIETLGYQIKDPRYDQDFASTYVSLETNQFKLSRIALETGFILPVAGDTVTVSYDYKSTGRVIDESTVAVSQVLNAIREGVVPISTEFTLAHAPIVNASDVLYSSAGVTFADPESNPPFSETHPAFTNEIPFKFEGMPSNTGEYSVDYNTGRVFVYGATTNNGTGNWPPVATYKYRKTFDARLDYTYNPDTYELVSSPLRDLTTEEAKISFDFEEALVPGIDYTAQVHTEVLDERKM